MFISRLCGSRRSWQTRVQSFIRLEGLSNPATVNQPGYYVLTAYNPQNGCSKSDSLNVQLLNVLVLNTSNDTLICNGSSATINASPVGGTPGFTYSWSNGGGNLPSTSVSPNDTTKFIITITDNAGCIGVDSITVFVPAPTGDSVYTFQPCDPNNPNGQIQVFGTGSIPPYQYAINSGTFQTSGIFTGLNYGTYTISVKDSLGCSFQSTAVIDSSSVLPAPDFILATTETRGDTFVLVDISNPRPDSVKWILPIGSVIINADPFNPQIIHSDTGAFQITMLAWFGTCQMSLSKNIVIMAPDTNWANGTNNNGIENLTLYPNPNTGQFTVDVSLYKAQSLAFFFFDAIGNEILRIPFSKTNFASANVNLSNSAPGTYIFKVVAEYDSKTRTFLINQH